MNRSRNCTAIKAPVSLVLLLLATAAGAAPIGTVTDLDGTLLVSRANGSVKVLAVGSEIEQGDVFSSRKATYATLTMVDDSTVTLGPDTNVKVERFVYYKHTPDHDGALFALANGSVRINTGVLGTRSGDTFTLATPTATMDVRGASLIAQYIVAEEAKISSHLPALRDPRLSNMMPVAYTHATADSGSARPTSHSESFRLAQVRPPSLSSPSAPSLAPGLYVHVIDGLINLSNPGGAQTFSAGQFGYTPNPRLPPVVVPTNPGILFVPPPAFSIQTPGSGSSSAPKSNAVDCEVR